MSELENCMNAIIRIFHKYSKREGDKYTLTKSELKELITQELPKFVAAVKDPAEFDSLMKTLDTDGNAECDFQEFMTFIAAVTSLTQLIKQFEDE
ncbi:protein S100-B-like [Neoarius graeffei]|uniref:protein S100-B-like n=1 Tax=Neoarius graeffei TaxID=443677 RepID=UPI00298BF0F1|nr:protein S100-B-like [Neoarius graeffei]